MQDVDFTSGLNQWPPSIQALGGALWRMLCLAGGLALADGTGVSAHTRQRQKGAGVSFSSVQSLPLSGEQAWASLTEEETHTKQSRLHPARLAQATGRHPPGSGRISKPPEDLRPLEKSTVVF